MFHVNGARRELSSMALDLIKEHGLTDIEYLQWLASEQQSVLRYMLREERHGDSSIPADEAREDDDDGDD